MTTINVTAEHIKNATPRKCHHCVIALAINDVLKPPYVGRAGLFNLTILERVGLDINDCETRQKFDTPIGIYDYMCRFDREEDVEPISFSLDIREEFLKCSSESPPS